MRDLPPPVLTQRASVERIQPIVLLVLGAAFLFAVSFDDGGYSLASRGMWAIAVWWVLALAAAAGWWRPLRLGNATVLVAALLAATAIATLVSAGWAANDARAFAEFNRVSLYLGVFILASAAAPHVPRGRWCDGIALALCAVAGIALLSRFLPERISDRGLSEAFPAAATRLSYPVGYWNGLAILVALAVPLLLHRAAAAGPAVLRALAVAPLPAIAATIYFASSRGGFATAAIGTIAFLLLGRERWSIAAAVAAGAAGSAIVLWYLAAHPTVANEPLSASGAERLQAALVVALGCLVAAALHALASRLLRARRIPRRASVGAVAVVVVLATVGLVAADPAERLSEFKKPPAAAQPTDDPIQAHLASFRGSGRWQFWGSALDAWEERPLLGHGGGSFEAWWTQNGSLALFVRDAHSLYLETLAELGVLGFALVVATLVAGLGAALVRSLARDQDVAVAAATAAFVPFAAVAAIEWVWEVPAVTIVGLSCLAVAIAAPKLASAPSGRGHAVARVGVAAAALALVVAQAIPLFADASVRESRAAVASDDLGAALGHAEQATEIQPWGPDPWLQLALVREQARQLGPAATAIRRATTEDRRDWRLWLVSARIHTKLGDIGAARRALERARTLNPRSPLFAPLERG